jgi:hypothetical protein
MRPERAENIGLQGIVQSECQNVFRFSNGLRFLGIPAK